jgi:bifunctional enzyme CysN/CysC
VDDGKSTLLARLLFETSAIFDDHLDAVRKTSLRKGDKEPNLALLLDGLKAEREQGITIDVAYRYLKTPRRTFILADCPGHEQYTRNMVTGASTADCAVLLLDASRGVTRQSRRHGFLVSLLQVPHVLVAVNKMDDVGFDQGVFDRIVDEYGAYARAVGLRDVSFIPISALRGDNVSSVSARMPWYRGPDVLRHLESLDHLDDPCRLDFRFPVQAVIRTDQAFRGYAGRIASGIVHPGDTIAVMPSGRVTRVASIETFDGQQPEAFPPQSVVVTLADHVDASRGCMLVGGEAPRLADHLQVTLCWLDEAPLRVGAAYWLKHTTQTVKAFVERVVNRRDIDTLRQESAAELGLNDVGCAEIRTTRSLCFDSYDRNRATGSFILVDPDTNHTVAAGLIQSSVRRESDRKQSPNTIPQQSIVSRQTRERRNGHSAAVLWFTGLSGSGKSTIGRKLEQTLFDLGCHTALLDGDDLRQGLCGDLGFTPSDRSENIRRAGEVARLLFESGHIVVCTFISPIAADRDAVRRLLPEGRFFEIHVDCPLAICIERDPNGLYGCALKGNIGQFTGISARYEIPAAPEVAVRSDRDSAEAIVAALVDRLRQDQIIRRRD